MHTVTVNLWTVNENGQVVPVGHNSPRQKPGDLVRDVERNALYRVYDAGQRLRWWYLSTLS
jgi:hypothetical protein